MTNAPPAHLSKSQIVKILNCGHSYYLERIEREPTLPSLNPVPGNVIHKVSEWYFGQELETGQKPEYAAMSVKAAEIFDEEMDKPEWFISQKWLKRFGFASGQFHRSTPEYQVQIEKDMPAIRALYCGQVIACLPVFYELAQKIKPVAVELPVDLSIPIRDTELKIKVIIDMICEFNWEEEIEQECQVPRADGKGTKKGKEVVKTGRTLRIESADIKVSGKAKTQKDLDNDNAMMIATGAHMVKYGRIPENLAYFNFVVKTSPKNHESECKLKIITTQVGVPEMETMINRAIAARNAVDCGVYLPADPTGWLCDPDFCQHFETCKFSIKKNYEQGEDE